MRQMHLTRRYRIIEYSLVLRNSIIQVSIQNCDLLFKSMNLHFEVKYWEKNYEIKNWQHSPWNVNLVTIDPLFSRAILELEMKLKKANVQNVMKTKGWLHLHQLAKIIRLKIPASINSRDCLAVGRCKDDGESSPPKQPHHLYPRAP